MDTKACNLTENEIKAAIAAHAMQMLQAPNDLQSNVNEMIDEHLERMNYLNKRLKAFKDEKPAVVAPPATEAKDGW